MARSKFLLVLFLGIVACAPSPLYVVHGHIGTVGEIPRDGRGEPVWGGMRRPLSPAPSPGLPSAPGIPITPPPGY